MLNSSKDSTVSCMYVIHSTERMYSSLLQQRKMQRLIFLLGSLPMRRGWRSVAKFHSCSGRLRAAAAAVPAATATATLGPSAGRAAASAARVAHTRELAIFEDRRICSSFAVSASPRLPHSCFRPPGACSSRPFTVTAKHGKQQQLEQKQSTNSSGTVEQLASFKTFDAPAGGVADISINRHAVPHAAAAAVTPTPLSTSTFASCSVAAAPASGLAPPADFQRASTSAAVGTPSAYISGVAPGSAAPRYQQPAVDAVPVYQGKALPPLTHPIAAATVTHPYQSSAGSHFCGGAAAGNNFSPPSVSAAAAAAAIPGTVSSAAQRHAASQQATFAPPHSYCPSSSETAAAEGFSVAARGGFPRSSFAASYSVPQHQQPPSARVSAAAAPTESDRFSPPCSSGSWGTQAGVPYASGWLQQQQQQQIPSAPAFSNTAASAAGAFTSQQQQQASLNSSRAAGSVFPEGPACSSACFAGNNPGETWESGRQGSTSSVYLSSFASPSGRSAASSFSRFTAAAAAPGVSHNAKSAAAAGSGCWTQSGSSHRSSGERYHRSRREQQQQQNFAGSRLVDIAWQEETLAPIKKNFYKETAAVAARNIEEVERILREHHIHLECYSSSKREDLPKPILSFEEAGFPQVILKQLQRMQFEMPTAIQKIGWPVALSGRDMIGIAQTGSGKTLGFLLPGLVHAAAQPPLQHGEGPLMLVLAPTRELAMQIRHECNRFTSGLLTDSTAAAAENTAAAAESTAAGTVTAEVGTVAAAETAAAAVGATDGGDFLTPRPQEESETEGNSKKRSHGAADEQAFFSNSSSSSNLKHRFRTACVYGGVPRQGQAAELRRGAEIVIATPGRLLDFLDLGITNLKRVSYVVLDEADRMMDMGFEPQVRKLFSQIRPDRQTLLWSATWPKEVRELAKAFCRTRVVKLQIGDAELQANASVAQRIEVVSPGQLQQRLLEVLQQIAGNKVLIFCETKRQCEQLCRELRYRQKRALAIHGDKEQRERDRILHDFRVGHCEILVATDVASRGLDIRDVRFVINYEMPKNIESYIHRIGRTGRAGNKGTAISFFEYDYYQPEKVNMAKRICDVMRGVGQDPPQELLRIAKS